MSFINHPCWVPHSILWNFSFRWMFPYKLFMLGTLFNCMGFSRINHPYFSRIVFHKPSMLGTPFNFMGFSPRNHPYVRWIFPHKLSNWWVHRLVLMEPPQLGPVCQFPWWLATSTRRSEVFLQRLSLMANRLESKATRPTKRTHGGAWGNHQFCSLGKWTTYVDNEWQWISIM